MFEACLKFNRSVIRKVYATQQLENGLTQFLIFDEYSEKWVWMPASEYIPSVNQPKEKR